VVIIDVILISYKNEIIMINTFLYLAACLSRHHDKYDPNQFKTSLQKFFIESGDKNGGTEKRKRKINEKKLEGQIKQKNLSKNSASDIFESSEEDVESSGNEAANFRKNKRNNFDCISSFFSSGSSDSDN